MPREKKEAKNFACKFDKAIFENWRISANCPE